MRDIDVRKRLHLQIKRDFANDPETVVIDELGICQGESRIDIAVVNGSLNGYEIKSDSDTLIRLPLQIEAYNRVFDKVTLVTSRSHLNKALNIIPVWWGTMVADEDKDHNVDMLWVRKPETNENVDPFSVVQLLWKNEVVSLIRDKVPNAKVANKTRIELWKILVNIIPRKELCSLVRDKLKYSKDRANWRSDSLQRLSGD